MKDDDKSPNDNLWNKTKSGVVSGRMNGQAISKHVKQHDYINACLYKCFGEREGKGGGGRKKKEKKKKILGEYYF